MTAVEVAPPDAAAVCLAFRLGAPLGDPAAVPGGLSHRLWRYTTTSGAFAVKRLNAPDDPSWASRVERAFSFETAAFAANVPMPRPVPNASTGGCLAYVHDLAGLPVPVRVHAWIEGQLVARADQAGVAPQVAAILARLHALDAGCPETLPVTMRICGDDHWRRLADRAQSAGKPWAVELGGALPAVRDLEAFVAEARLRVDPLLMSHRDADPKNVMRREDGTVLLIDWDAAGPVSARMDVANHALVWSGVFDTEFDAVTARRFVHAYGQAGGAEFALEREDFAEFANILLQWTEFNIRRALGDRLNDESDRALGERIARDGLQRIPVVLRSLDEWAGMLGSA